MVDAVTDRSPVDWAVAEGAGTPGERQALGVLRRLSAAQARRTTEDTSYLGRRLPLAAECVKGLAALRAVVGLGGTVSAMLVLDIWTLPFVSAVIVAFLFVAAVLDLSGRDRRARTLALVYWFVAAWFATGGVSYLARAAPDSETLSALARVRPESFLAAALWAFVREFPRTHYLSALDATVRGMTRVSIVAGAAMLALSTAGAITTVVFDLTVVGLTLTAVVVLLARWRHAEGLEAVRVRWLLTAMFAAFLPALLVAQTTAAFRITTAGKVIGVAVYGPLLALPFVTAYAVASTRVLPVGLALVAGLRYVVATQFVLWSVLAAFALLVLRVAALRGAFRDGAWAGPGALVVIAAVVGAVVALRPGILRLLRRWANPGAQTHVEALARLSGRLRDARTALEVADVFAEAATSGLRASAQPYLLRFGRLVPVSDTGIALPAETTMWALLGTGEPSVVGEDLRETVYPVLPSEDQEWVTRSRLAVVAPLASGGDPSQVLGMITIERRRDALGLTREDLEFLKTCTSAVLLSCRSLATGSSMASEPLDEVSLECGRCGKVHAWTAADSLCGCGGSLRRGALPKRLAGRFEMVRLLGSGGMGTVYQATDGVLQRDVALKTLLWLSPAAAERALAEARALARISHPNVAVLFASETWRQTPILVMEYLAGGTLADRLRAGPLSTREAVQIAGEVASALEFVHSAGRYHGDVKPSNVGLSPTGVPKLLDFGLSGGSHRPSTGAVAVGDAVSKSVLGGTPAYLSPDVWGGAAPGPATDVWALAVVLYEMVAGHHPYGALRDSRAIADRVQPGLRDLADVTPTPILDLLEQVLCSQRVRDAAGFRAGLGRTAHSA